MDILHLVDRLEELFNESKPIPLTHKVLVDEERMLDLIDQMRLAVPEEIKNSQQIINQKERILAQANEEARRTIDLAKEQASKLVEGDEIVQKAEVMGENIILKAKDETKLIKREADTYAIDSLEHLEVELGRILMQVRNGINSLKSETSSLPDGKPAGENIRINQETGQAG
jgi:hypothetical protein